MCAPTLLTFSVVDDLAGIVVIAVVYSGHIRLPGLLAGVAVLAVVAVLRAARVRYGPVYALAGVAAWIAVFKSGVDPVVVGMLVGLLTCAQPAARSDLERATDLFRLFRGQPTPELARSAREGVSTAVSPNDRLQQLYHPATSYVIVPLFALSNTGIVISGGFLARAYASPVTLGILFGYVAGKPAGTAGAAWLVTRVSRGRIRPPIGWAAVAGAGALAGIGFNRVPADRLACLPWRAAAGGEGRGAVRGSVRVRADLRCVPDGRAAAEAAADPRAAGRRPSGAPTRRGGISCARKPRRCLRPTSSTWTAR